MSKTLREFNAFIEWAKGKGYDTAHTFDTDRSRWVALNPMTADLWECWCAALADQAQAEPVAFQVVGYQTKRGALYRSDFEVTSDGCEPVYRRVTAAPQPAAQPVAVPDGYALVPVEPTREMRKAATIEQEHHRRMSLSLFGDEPAAVIYRAMLSAAPKVQQ